MVFPTLFKVFGLPFCRSLLTIQRYEKYLKYANKIKQKEQKNEKYSVDISHFFVLKIRFFDVSCVESWVFIFYYYTKHACNQTLSK